MQTQRKELNYEGQNIFVGLDVHLKSWNTSIYFFYILLCEVTSIHLCQPSFVISEWINSN